MPPIQLINLPDPSRDPNYASLYQKTPGIADSILGAMSQYNKNTLEDAQRQKALADLANAKKIQDAQTMLSEAYKTGGAKAFYDKAKEAYAGIGDVSTTSAIDKLQLEQQNIESEQEKRQFDIIKSFANKNPDLAMKLYNASTFAVKHGQITDPSMLQEQPKIESGAGVLYHQDPITGKPVIDYTKPIKTGGTGKPGAVKPYMGSDGTGIYNLDPKNPDDQKIIQDNQLVPYDPSLLRNKKKMEVFGIGGDTVDPIATPTPMPGSKSYMLVPKLKTSNIEQP
jgi:hypothetical protein